METKNFGLIYGMNLFVALVLQTGLQVLILDKVLAITVATKFVVLGGFLVSMFFLFGFISLREWIRSKHVEERGGELQSINGEGDLNETNSNISNRDDSHTVGDENSS